jgi:RIO kinase 1
MKIDSEYLDDLYWEEETDLLPQIKNMPKRATTQKSGPKPRKADDPPKINEQIDDLREYDFTYKASRHESWWLLDSLGPFYDEQWFDDVLRMVKGGKEASVYLCSGAPASGTDLIAAKVYRPRELRNLRKDHLYREGRANLDETGLEILDDRALRAIHKGTAFGKKLQHTSWLEHEFQAMKLLSEAGCDVPQPYASGHNAILMDFVGDLELNAPALNEITLTKKEARTLFERVVHNLEIMLSHARIHGDLSAYNILYWGGEIALIDFPQAINPRQNRNAYRIFERDVTRVCDYFASQGIQRDPKKLARDLWSKHGYSAGVEIPVELFHLQEADEPPYDQES